MDPCDLIERLEQIAAAYREQAKLFLGRRRQWRLDRADYLEGRAEYGLHWICGEAV